MTPDEILKEIAAIEKEEAKLISRVSAYTETHKCEFIKPYKWQKKLLEAIGSKNTTVVPCPNKTGKTMIAANITISWALGYEPWNKVSPEHLGAVKVKDFYYAPSSLGIAPPVRIRVTGEDWLHHIGETVVPEIKKWAPEGMFTSKKNSQGIEYLWTWKNGSTIEIMTHDQDVKLFEGWLGHGWWADEPPPKAIYSGMSRGLFTTGGKMLLTMTPLKEAWILDDLVLSGRKDVGVIDGLSILDNDDLKKHDVDLLKSAGLSDEIIEKYLVALLDYKDMDKWLGNHVKDAAIHLNLVSKLKVQRFIQDIPEDERDARIKGQFKHLVGRVLKEFNRETHVIEPFKVPTDWPVVCQIDLHLSKPHAVGFYAVDKQGRRYIIDEIWQNMGPEELADDIIRRKKANCWRLERVQIDPLSKGDNNFVRNRMGTVDDSFTIIKKRLSPHGMILDVATKDKDSGVRNLKDWLKGVNKMPCLFIFDTCEKHLHQIQRWVFDDDGKPKKENDDFPECMYRFAIMGVEYTDPMDFNKRTESYDMGVV